MQLTTFSTLAPVAAASLAFLANQAKAAPLLEERYSCPEASRFGGFNVTAPSTVRYGDEIKVSYVQHCPDVQDIRPTSLTLQIGGSGPEGRPFVQVTPPKTYQAGQTLEYTTTIPDFTLSNFYKGDELSFFGTIQYPSKGPHGGEVDNLYTFQQGFTYERSSN